MVETTTLLPVDFTPAVLENRTRDYMQGATEELCGLNIGLAVLILLQNCLVIVRCYPHRTRFIPKMLLGIACMDMLLAQGTLFLSAFAHKVFSKQDLQFKWVLYGLFYYQGTAAAGETCSKIYYSALSLTLTLRTARPGHPLNEARIQLILSAITFCVIIAHFSDAACALYLCLFTDDGYEERINLVSTLDVPGLWSITAASCALNPTSTQCSNIDGSNSFLTSLLFALDTGIPPFLVLVCTALLFYKWRNITEGKHAALTVLLLSIIFFVTHAAFLAIAAFSYFSFDDSDLSIADKDRSYSYKLQGVVTGLAVFTLPLLNAFLFPFVLLLREQHLGEYLRGVAARIMENFRETSYPYLIDE